MDAPTLAPPFALKKSAPPSLLPEALARPASLLWLWVLPLAVLLLLNIQGYQLIAGNMDARQLADAHRFGLAGAGNLLAGLALSVLTVWTQRRRSPTAAANHLAPAPRNRLLYHLDWIVPLATIALQTAYLWFAVYVSERTIPLNVRSWIFPPERFLLYQFSFAMLPAALGVLRLACVRSTTSDLGKSIGRAVVLAVAAPLALYLLLLVFTSGRTPSRLESLIIALSAVTLGAVLIVTVVRSLVLGLHALQDWHVRGERLAIALCAFVLPLAGLLLNRTIPFPVDLQAWEVYALTAANAAILLFASFQHARRPLLSFCLLCATFPFSIYFFAVFLPYTPLSILAIIAFGLGFLALTPILLFVLHLFLLNKARRSPLLDQRPAHLALISLFCCSLLPGFFVARGLGDKAALHSALDYVFSPAIERGQPAYPASLPNLRRALDNHRSYKNGIYYPLLSDFYAWLVFNRLVLPDDKLARLEQTFFSTASSSKNLDPVRRGLSPFSNGSSVRERTLMPRAAPPPRNVAVTNLAMRLAPADAQNTTATLALTLTNTDPPGPLGAEYVTTLPLPAGIFVSGFRLHIDGTPVPGRIVEKKTALWVYTMIRDSERRDPGLLFYRNPGELELRVFPILAGKPATVEIDFLVPAPLDSASTPADTRDPAATLAHFGALLRPQLTHDARGTYAAGGLDRLNVPVVEREPYLHLIVDRSLDHGFTGDLSAAIRTAREKFPTARQARVTLAHHDIVDLVPALTSLDQLPALTARQLDRSLPLSGGLALDLALARAIRQHRDADLDTSTSASAMPPHPIFLILSRHAATRTLELDRTADWSDLLPALELHELSPDGTLFTHLKPASFLNPLLRLGASARPLTANRATRFRSTATHHPLEFWSPLATAWEPVTDLTAHSATTPWSRAAALQLRQQDHARSPGDTAFDLKSLVQASRETGVLLASTSYIVVENSAQWRMLEESEKQKLKQNSALAFRETASVAETPVPSALYVGLVFIACLVVRRIAGKLRFRRE